MMTSPDLLPWPERILMTADTSDGMWSYALELSRALVSFGIDVTLATMGAPRSRVQRRESDAIYGLDVREIAVTPKWNPESRSEIAAAARWLLALEEDVEPSLIHLNHVTLAGIGWSAPTLVVAHACELSWWDAVKGRRAPADWERYRLETQAGLRTASLMVTTTTAARLELERYYGAARTARVIRHGRDGRWFVPAAKEPVVVSIGRLCDEAKNLRALDDVAAALPWPVYVISETAPATHYRPLGHLDLEGLRDWLSRASIFAMPAKYEPFGQSVLDAALSGCALVLGDIPSLRETWDGAAVFVPAEDRAALAGALADLIASPEECQRLASEARSRAREYSASRMASGYLAAYSALMAARPVLRKVSQA
jgi:glycogen(starch) synthase